MSELMLELKLNIKLLKGLFDTPVEQVLLAWKQQGHLFLELT